MNRGRASRTTHPKTIHLLEQLFSAISEATFRIVTPFYNRTKADIVKILVNSSQANLISSSVSCAHTRMNSRTATHCGCCNQCVDRRIATFASGLHEKGIYDIDFLENPLNNEGTTIVIDYFNFISQVHQMSLTDFCCSFANELADALSHLPQSEHHSRTAEIYQLFEAHSQMVRDAYANMHSFSNRIGRKKVGGTIFDLIEKDHHLKQGIALVACQAADKLARVIPTAFQSAPPANENVLNDQIQAVLLSENYYGLNYSREGTAGKFILSQSIPDHIVAYDELFLEAKLIKAKASPSKFEEQIAADITKYRANNSRTYLLFVIYDIGRRIADSIQWCEKLEAMGENIKVCVIK